MKNLVLTTVLFVILSSCAIHSGFISSSSINRNVKYVDIAYGVSQTNRVFGLGGLSEDALIYKAKCKLINERPLNPNEEYVNFTLDFKNSNFFFYQQTKVTVTADVVKYSNDSTSSCYLKEYKNKLAGNNLSPLLFTIGDTIIDNKLNKGMILSFENAKTARVIFKTPNDKIKVRKIPISGIYSVTKSYNGHKIGDSYKKSLWVYGTEKDYEGKIIGIGIYSMLVKFGKVETLNNSKVFPVQKIKYK